jgi:hypothetical protein
MKDSHLVLEACGGPAPRPIALADVNCFSEPTTGPNSQACPRSRLPRHSLPAASMQTKSRSDCLLPRTPEARQEFELGRSDATRRYTVECAQSSRGRGKTSPPTSPYLQIGWQVEAHADVLQILVSEPLQRFAPGGVRHRRFGWRSSLTHAASV